MRLHTVPALGGGGQALLQYDTSMDAASLQIRLYPDPGLAQVAEPVEAVTPEIQALAHRMGELMVEADGIGLAAPQVGVSKRLFVTRDPDDPEAAVVWINPTLEVIDDTCASSIEGCLSLPDIDVSVVRPVGIRITGTDLDGATCTLESDQHIARVWQHEYDHLEGRLIIDRMSTMDRLRSRRALRALKGR